MCCMCVLQTLDMGLCLVLASIMALTFVDCGSRALSGDWAWGKGRDRSSDGKVTGKRQCTYFTTATEVAIQRFRSARQFSVMR
jgi:hypothetical protein